MKVERVPPETAARPASLILKEAWAAPSLHYTPEYMAWQLAFPGACPAVAVLATDEEEPVGFAGSTPRRVRYAGEHREVHVVSFVAVRPPWRGRGVVSLLYRELLDGLRETGAWLLTFAQEDSLGETSLLEAYSRSGLSLRRLATHHLFGFRPGTESSPGPLAASAQEGAVILEAFIPAADTGTVLWSTPTPEEASHLDNDPRRRACLAVRSGSGEPLAAGLVVRAEMTAPSGPELTTLLETVHLSWRQPAALRRLFEAASAWGGAGGGTVTSSGLSSVHPEVLRATRVRRLPGGFSAFLATPTMSSVAPIATTVPVI